MFAGLCSFLPPSADLQLLLKNPSGYSTREPLKEQQVFHSINKARRRLTCNRSVFQGSETHVASPPRTPLSLALLQHQPDQTDETTLKTILLRQLKGMEKQNAQDSWKEESTGMPVEKRECSGGTLLIKPDKHYWWLTKTQGMGSW